jgi:hypothetical protein
MPWIDAPELGGPEHVLRPELAQDEGAHRAAFRHLLRTGRAAFGERDQQERAVPAFDHDGARAQAAGSEEVRTRQDRGLETAC